MGGDRTFEQDPKYALRLLVDIAIRALSPAVNDPTTAVQALDQIEDLLRRWVRGGWRSVLLATQRQTPIGDFVSRWEDFLDLAFEEIRFYGANSVQVMRRMKALISDLISALPQERHKPLLQYQQRLTPRLAEPSRTRKTGSRLSSKTGKDWVIRGDTLSREWLLTRVRPENNNGSRPDLIFRDRQ